MVVHDPLGDRAPNGRTILDHKVQGGTSAMVTAPTMPLAFCDSGFLGINNSLISIAPDGVDLPRELFQNGVSMIDHIGLAFVCRDSGNSAAGNTALETSGARTKTSQAGTSACRGPTAVSATSASSLGATLDLLDVREYLYGDYDG